MCGIGGYVRLDGCLNEKDVKKIKNLCVEMEKRGTDAHGFIIIDESGRVERLFKLPVKASTLWEELYDIFKAWMIGRRAVLFHTRATTSGTEKDNKNNHPFNIDNWYLAHNGSAGIKRYTYGVYKGSYGYYNGYYSRRGWGMDEGDEFSPDEPRTDSYRYLFKPLVRKLNRGEDIVKAIEDVWDENSVFGSIWLYDSVEGKIYLVRRENPLSYSQAESVFIFASTGKEMEMPNGEIKMVSLDDGSVKTIAEGKSEFPVNSNVGGTKKLTKSEKRIVRNELSKYLKKYHFAKVYINTVEEVCNLIDWLVELEGEEFLYMIPETLRIVLTKKGKKVVGRKVSDLVYEYMFENWW